MTPEGERALRALRADPPRSLVALDYDGTLAPVVSRPQDAVPAPGAVAALVSLARRTRLAIVTGRQAQVVVDLAGLEDGPELVVLGQYGAERWHAGELHVQPPLPGVALARAELPALVGAGEVEDKGSALVVHTRNTPDPIREQQRLVAPLSRLAQRTGLELHLGKLVVELRPPGFGKGAALLSLCDPLPAAVVYVGDDIGDLAAYDAVAQLRERGVPGLAAAVAGAEAPQQLLDRADVVLDSPSSVVAFLADLLD